MKFTPLHDRVLVADDQADVLQALRFLLIDLHCEVCLNIVVPLTIVDRGDDGRQIDDKTRRLLLWFNRRIFDGKCPRHEVRIRDASEIAHQDQNAGDDEKERDADA